MDYCRRVRSGTRQLAGPGLGRPLAAVKPLKPTDLFHRRAYVQPLKPSRDGAALSLHTPAGGVLASGRSDLGPASVDFYTFRLAWLRLLVTSVFTGPYSAWRG